MKTETFDIIKQSLYSTKISRLLAQENIAVRFDETAETASFSPEFRTLTFPYSTAFMDHDIHELFMMHEIAHALFLPVDTFRQIKNQQINSNCFNIVVDIRDERKIKERFPGCIKTMQRGYEKLLEQEFFGKISELQYKSFGSRLNVFAKCGIKNTHFLKFSQDEMDFYWRCMAAETLDEVFKLSMELNEWKESYDLDELEKFVAESIDDELSESELAEHIAQEIERIKADNTQTIFDEAFKNSIISNSHVVNYKSLNRNDVHIIDIQTFNGIVHNNAKDLNVDLTDFTQNVRDLRRSIGTTVDSMVKVFESKKAAEKYRNTRITTSGMIDINQVYKYRYDDRIFGSRRVVPNSKNHAYYILVDFSGSMVNVMDDVIEQIVVIVEFFRRIQVPYKVVGFGICRNREMEHGLDDLNQISPVPTLVRTSYDENLLEILNSNQTTSEHNMSVVGLTKMLGFSFGGTPTGFAMLNAEIDANEFFNQHNVSKKHLIVMTDGCPTDLVTNAYSGRRAKTLVIADPVTRKTVITRGASPYSAINAMGKIFENRYGITLTSICLLKTLDQSRVEQFISTSVSDKQRHDFRQNGYVMITDPNTKNAVYFAKPFSVETDIENFDISEKTTSTQIARALLRNVKNIKKSRIFLNALAETLS